MIYMRRAVVLFRKDLRFYDNEPLRVAAESYDEIIPVYIFDKELLKSSQYNSARIDSCRLKFILSALKDLNKSLERAGGKLHILIGNPIEEILNLIRRYDPSSIYLHKETGVDEIKFEEGLQLALSENVKVVYYWDKTLFHIVDLPFEIENLPEIFTNFRKLCEAKCEIRELVENRFNVVVPENMSGEIPTLMELGFEDIPASHFSTFNFVGGETAGLKRIENYVWETRHILKYKLTRNELLGGDYSSKFSPYLAHGCVSPRRIYSEIKRFEEEVFSNESTYWLIFELMWRDFFKFVAFKYGKKLFAKAGINSEIPKVKTDFAKVKAWKNGKTGIPFIDANMRELNETGFMSNRGRQNVAAFFVNDLNQDWREGAAYFEQRLIDYDVESNWGNWAYLAGVGNDPRKDRRFNVIGQAKKYDPMGKFVKYWLPELKELDDEDVHEPWRLSDNMLIINNLENSAYARPIFISTNW